MGFHASSPSVEARVIQVVKEFAAKRKDEHLASELSVAEKDRLAGLLGKEVSGGTSFDDLGFDALDKVEVLLEVEDRFGHVIPDDDADRTHSVSATVEYLTRTLGSSA